MEVTPVRYRVDLAERAQHLVTVTVTVPADLAAGARLVMATWTPGSYVERNYVHHVQQVVARGPDGGAVELTPDGHTAWTLPDDLDGPAEVEFELYANELTVRTNHVDDHHALLVGAATFPFVDGAESRPHVVKIDTDEPVWGLLPGDGEGGYRADDRDHLIDSAFEVGDHPVQRYDVAGVPHEFVYAGHGGRPDLGRIGEDLQAIGDAAVELFDGDLPIDRYTFLTVAWDAGGGGLEHRDGAVVQMPAQSFRHPDRYARFQSLLAHEYLHLWNVKRLVPRELTSHPIDRPAHTTSLWVAEGWTSYYDRLLVHRAGLWKTKRFREQLRDGIVEVTETPGAELQSVEEASYHAWTGLYVRDENSRNKGVNYYGHGALLAWCLDLTIRAEDPEGPGLDEAFRRLWRAHGGTRDGYTPDDVRAAVSEAAGRDLSPFFDAHVTGRTLPPVEGLLQVVGLRLRDPDDADEAPPQLGVDIDESDDGIRLSTVLRGRAAWRAGLTGGDQLVAIDGTRVGRGELEAALRGYEPGQRVEVVVFRGPRLLTRTVVLEEPRPKRELVPVESPSDAQRAAHRRWSGHDLEDTGEVGDDAG